MKDYLIIGFGLSGMALARTLEKRELSFHVFENFSQASSQVAGGLMNPVVLKRFTLAWNADEQLPFAVEFYEEFQNELPGDFLKKQAVYRRFFSAEEQNNWFAAADNPLLLPFLNLSLRKKIEGISADFNYGKVNNTAVLDTEGLLTAYQKILEERTCFSSEKFDYEALRIEADFVEYKGLKARKIIFAEGFGLLQNPYFNELPLVGNKGEYLIIKAPQLASHALVKSSVFIIPLGNELFKVGATYNRDDLTERPTAQAREYLVQKLKSFIEVPFEIVDQVAGVRPTVTDRKPLLGEHHEHKLLLVCNGFGSRGVMIAPTAAKWLIDYSEMQKALPKEVDINRFKVK